MGGEKLKEMERKIIEWEKDENEVKRKERNKVEKVCMFKNDIIEIKRKEMMERVVEEF